jgi:hypothetical protein
LIGLGESTVVSMGMVLYVLYAVCCACCGCEYDGGIRTLLYVMWCWLCDALEADVKRLRSIEVVRITTAHLRTVVDSPARIGNPHHRWLFCSGPHTTTHTQTLPTHSPVHFTPKPPHPGYALGISDISQPDSPTHHHPRNQEPRTPTQSQSQSP